MCSYNPYIPTINGLLGNCIICQEALARNDLLVAHDGEGHKHPIHKKCTQEMLENNFEQCPICRVAIDKNSLLSWKERITKVIEKALSNNTAEVFWTTIENR